MKVLTLAAAAVAALVAAPAGAQPVREPPAGRLIGTFEGQVAVFRGIPYARPPLGPLRWQPPRPLPRWQGTRQATRFGHICMQVPNPSDSGVGRETPSEDCLTLNVWAPAEASRGERRPVMLWLHGGGYTSGSGSAPLYDGSALARAGVLVVTVNYRLGRFGFFAHPALGKEANYGLLDQLAAVDWVRRNIGAFGGDRSRITLFGNSAGGESVLLLMTSPKARGKFARAIVQSGLGGRRLPALTTGRGDWPSAEATGITFARQHGAIDATSLRALSAETLLRDPPSLYRGFGPVIDGRLIREDPLTAFRWGRAAKVPMIIGYNSHEVPVSAIGGVGRIDEFLRFSRESRAAWRSLYPSDDLFGRSIVSDVLFRAPAIRIAREHARNGNAAYLYEFSILPPQSSLAGAPHASERAYVFGNMSAAPWPTDAQDSVRSASIRQRWVAFAHGRKPLPGIGGDWSLVPDTRLCLSRDGDSSAPVINSFMSPYLLPR